MWRKIGSMAEKQTTMEKSQESILKAQNAILTCLDTIERALHVHPQKHSTPFRYRQHNVESSWLHGQNHWFDEDDYGSEWNRPDTIHPPTSYTGSHIRPFTHRQDFELPYSENNQYSFRSFDLPADPPSFNSLHSLADRNSLHADRNPLRSPADRNPLRSPADRNPLRSPADCNPLRSPADRSILQSPPDQHSSNLRSSGEHSLDAPEPFPIKFTGNSLPSSEIDKTTLQPVKTILHKFSKLHCESKIGTLAVKLAKVSIFGDQVLVKCTVMGERELPGLPAAELMELKRILFRQFPKLWGSRHEFEPLWKVCVDCLGQACKRLRLKKL